jgi:SAM-dependent methyltransferase
VPSDEWARWRQEVDLEGYDERWAKMAAAGEDPHGEVGLVVRYAPRSVLDAGCGTGRVAVELDRRGVEVVGADLDPDLLERARRKAPHLTWVRADLAELDLDRTFDLVVMAGNVIGFVAPERRGVAVARLAAHVAPGGRLVSGAQLRPGWPDVATYDRWCTASGLVLEDRFATWDGEPFAAGGGYAVAVHRRPPA